MRLDYQSANICYAVGDAVAQMMGAGPTNRQPAAGVEEKITSLVKEQATDGIGIYDGTTFRRLIDAANLTGGGPTGATQVQQPVYSMGLMITNSVYLRKEGTTDIIGVSGVQTNV